MKRLYLVTMMVLFSISLTGCEGFFEPKVIDRSPVIEGETYVEFEVNSEEPDWKTYVSALDDNDGVIVITDEMIESNVDFTMVGMYEVRFYIPDLSGNSTLFILDVSIIEELQPTFTLKGADEITINVYDYYLDPGATALDKYGVAVPFTVEGRVNSLVVGTYTLEYHMEGNEEVLTRLVHVVDNEAPEIVIDIVRVLYEEQLVIDWLDYVIEVSDNYSDVSIEVFTEELDLSSPGTYEVTYKATDEAGNETTVLVKVILSEVLIMINGDSQVVHEVHTPYVDKGASVVLTNSSEYAITVDNGVNEHIVGDYTVTYSVEGYEDLTVTRTVSVVDTIAPIVSLNNPLIYKNSEPIDWVTSGYLTVEDNYYDDTLLEVLEDNVDYNTSGEYEIIVRATDLSGNSALYTFVVRVGLEVTYPTGIFNYKFASSDIRHTFMAAAEKYLLNNQYAGVPLFSNASFALYSWRVQLPVDEYLPVIGFGEEFGTMSADDSSVLMPDGMPGNAGEYTYRTTISTSPQTFNQWLYDTSTDATLMSKYLDSLYKYVINDEKTGYDVVPSMATSDPLAINPKYTESGKQLSTTWSITLRDDLEWFYHPNTDISALPLGHEKIDANDFVDTYKLALDNEWFRAISGGGDFVTSATSIKGMQEYVDGDADWTTVGIKNIDDTTIEFTFVNDMSEWEVTYWLSSFVMTPINVELYNVLGTSYGTSEETIAYHGAYYIESYDNDVLLTYKENPVYHSPEEYFYTGYTYAIIEDSELRFEEFIIGQLESSTLPSAEYDNYKNYPGIRQIPGATVFRIMINGLKTIENQQDQFPDSSWVPEPILGNQNFKQAMYHAIDRQKLATDVLGTNMPSMYLFSDAYLVDAELGIQYRKTEQGLSVGEGLSPATHGYNFDAAKAYFDIALSELIEEGYYVPGTENNPTIIDIDFHIFSGSESQELMGAYLETAFEDAFQSETHNIKVDLHILAKDFPGIYYDYMMIGEFDLSIGGISGSTLDAASFLDTYSSDNRSGFTLNWGIDTSVAEIEVNYYDLDGVRHREMWSFDAICSVLNGEKYISAGEEAEGPSLENFTYTPTSVSFEVTKFDSSDYANFTYTLYTYDLAAGYVEVAGHVDVAITDAMVTIDGLLPGFEPSTYYNYLGDYEVHLNFDYTAVEDKTGSYIAPWWLQPAALTGEVTAAVDSATIVVTLGEGQTGVTAAKVVDGDGVDVAGAAVDFADLAAVAVTGLAADTTYFVEFTMADGNIAVVAITTPAS